MPHTQPKRLIVQSWRSRGWESDDIDSILVLSFYSEGDAARIELVHANVPVSDYAGVCQGWEKFYWTPWRAYLEEHS
jgi:activator of HSP90 ATPase